MSDLTQMKTDYMNLTLKKREQIDKMREAVNMVLAGGVTGLQEASKTHPDLILHVLKQMLAVIEGLEAENSELIEHWFTGLDNIEELAEAIQARL